MRILRLIPPILFGLTLGGLLGWIITGDVNYTILFSVGLGPAIMASVFIGMGSRGTVRSGGLAAGRIESVQRVGATPSGIQQADVRLSVFSQDDSPYQTTMRTPVDDVALRQLIVGAFIPVQRLGPKTRPDVTFAPTAPKEWLDQVAKLKAEEATLPTASVVKPWETATTTTPGTAKPGTPKRKPARFLGLAIVLVVAVLVLIPAYQSIGRGINNIALGEWDGSNMATGLYQQESVDQMIAAAGTSQFTNLGFYPNYILGDAVSKSSDDHTDEIEWRYGRAFVDGPTSIQSDDLQRELFDVSALDISMVGQVARDGVQRSGIEHPESVYAFVREDFGEGDPLITISISGPYDSLSYTYDFDGELISSSD